MSDVMVLLLTFFMLTATFTKEEPVKVNVPGSVSDIKIPENNLLTIYVSPLGKVFMNMDNPTAQKAMAQNLVDNKKLELNSATAQTVLRSSDVRERPSIRSKVGWNRATSATISFKKIPMRAFRATAHIMNSKIG